MFTTVVDFRDKKISLTFDVVPSYTVLRKAILADVVGHNNFHMTTKSGRGAVIQLTSDSAFVRAAAGIGRKGIDVSVREFLDVDASEKQQQQQQQAQMQDEVRRLASLSASVFSNNDNTSNVQPVVAAAPSSTGSISSKPPPPQQQKKKHQIWQFERTTALANDAKSVVFVPSSSSSHSSSTSSSMGERIWVADAKSSKITVYNPNKQQQQQGGGGKAGLVAERTISTHDTPSQCLCLLLVTLAPSAQAATPTGITSASKTTSTTATTTTVWAAFSDKTIQVISTTTAKVVQTLAEHSGAVVSMVQVLSYVFSGARDFTVIQWNAETFAPLKLLAKHSNTVRCLVGGYRKLFSGGDDRAIILWNAETAEIMRFQPEAHRSAVTALEVHRYATSALVTSASFSSPLSVSRTSPRSPSLSSVASATAGGSSSSFPASPGSPPSRGGFVAPKKGAATATTTSSQLWSGGEDGTIAVWDLDDLSTFAVLERFSSLHHGAVHCIKSVGSKVVSSGADNKFLVFDPMRLAVISEVTHPHKRGPLFLQPHVAVRYLFRLCSFSSSESQLCTWAMEDETPPVGNATAALSLIDTAFADRSSTTTANNNSNNKENYFLVLSRLRMDQHNDHERIVLTEAKERAELYYLASNTCATMFLPVLKKDQSQRLQKRLDEALQRNKELHHKLSLASAPGSNNNSNSNCVSSSSSSLSSLSTSLQQEHRNLEQRHKLLQADHELTQTELRQEREQHKKTLDELNALNETHINETAKLKTKLVHVEEQYSRLHDEFAVLQRSSALTRDDVATENERLQKQLADAKRRWKEEVSALEETLQERTAAHNDLRTQLDGMDDKHTQHSSSARLYQEKHKQATTELEQLQKQLQSERAKFEKYSSEQEETLLKLKNEVMAAETAMANDRLARGEAERRLQAAEQNIEGFQRRYREELQTAKETQALDGGTMEQKMRTLEEKLGRQLDEAQIALDEAHTQSKQFETQLSEHAQQIDQLERDSVAWKKRCGGAEGKLGEQQQQHDAALQYWHRVLQEKELEMDEYKRRVDTDRGEEVKARTEGADALHQAEAALQTLSRENTTLHSDLEVTRRKYADLDSEIKRVLEKARSDKDAAEHERTDSTRLVDALRSELNAVRQQLQSGSMEFDAVSHHAAELEKVIQDVRSQSANDMEHQRGMLQEKINECEDTRHRLNDSQLRLSDSTSNAQRLEFEVTVVTRKNKELQEEMDQLCQRARADKTHYETALLEAHETSRKQKEVVSQLTQQGADVEAQLRRDLDKLCDEHRYVQQEAERAQKETRAQLRAKEGDHDELTRICHELRQKLVETADEMSDIQEQHLQHVRGLQTKHDEENTLLMSKLTSVASEHQAQRLKQMETVEEMTHKKREAERQLELTQHERETLRKREVQLQRELQIQHTEHEGSMARVNKQVKLGEDLRKQADEMLDKERKLREEERDKTTQQLSRCTDEMNQLTLNAQSAARNIASLELQLEHERKLIAALEDENTRLSAPHESITAELGQLRMINSALSDDNKALSQSVVEKQDRVAALDRKLRAIEEDWRASSESEQGATAAAAAMMVQKEEELRGWKEAHHNTEQERSRLEEEVRLLNADIGNYHRERAKRTQRLTVESARRGADWDEYSCFLLEMLQRYFDDFSDLCLRELAGPLLLASQHSIVGTEARRLSEEEERSAREFAAVSKNSALIQEVQDELRSLYAKYTQERDAHDRTRVELTQERSRVLTMAQPPAAATGTTTLSSTPARRSTTAITAAAADLESEEYLRAVIRNLEAEKEILADKLTCAVSSRHEYHPSSPAIRAPTAPTTTTTTTDFILTTRRQLVLNVAELVSGINEALSFLDTEKGGAPSSPTVSSSSSSLEIVHRWLHSAKTRGDVMLETLFTDEERRGSGL